MVRKHKLLKTLADLKLDKQVRGPPTSVQSKLQQSNRSSNALSPPMICHGSESCGCLCHYAKDDPPPCYSCCYQDQKQATSDNSLAQKVLLGKKDSLSRGRSHHLKDYVIRDEFGCEIPKYRKKMNRKSLHSSTLALNANDSLRLPRESSVSQVDALRLPRESSSQIDDLNIEKLLRAANKSSNHRIMVNNIFNRDSRLNTILPEEDIENRLSLQHHPPPVNHRIPTQCRQQVERRVHRRVVRDNFGLEIRDSSHEGCTVS